MSMKVDLNKATKFTQLSIVHFFKWKLSFEDYCLQLMQANFSQITS